MNGENTPAQIHEIDIFGYDWIRRRLRTPASRRNLLLLIWLAFGVLPLIAFIVVGQLEDTLLMEGFALKAGENAMGIVEDIVFLSYFVWAPAFFSLAILYFPRLADALHSLRGVIAWRPSDESFDGAPARVAPDSDSALLSEAEFEGMLDSCGARARGEGKFKYLKTLFLLVGLAWVAFTAHQHWYAFDSYGNDLWSSQEHLASFVARTLYELVVFGFILPITGLKLLAILHSMRSISRELWAKRVLRNSTRRLLLLWRLRRRNHFSQMPKTL